MHGLFVFFQSYLNPESFFHFDKNKTDKQANQNHKNRIDREQQQDSYSPDSCYERCFIKNCRTRHVVSSQHDKSDNRAVDAFESSHNLRLRLHEHQANAKRNCNQECWERNADDGCRCSRNACQTIADKSRCIHADAARR
ncbi:hypothetical protein D3C85_1395920 [compost metagenome]